MECTDVEPQTLADGTRVLCNLLYKGFRSHKFKFDFNMYFTLLVRPKRIYFHYFGICMLNVHRIRALIRVKLPVRDFTVLGQFIIKKE